jgi:sensor c-di-GMP phosphodiesterase-like protein
MSKLLEVTVTAEGVETQEQLNFLLKRQCDNVQGYLLSKPVPVAQADKLLAEENGKAPENASAPQQAAKENGVNASLAEVIT